VSECSLACSFLPLFPSPPSFPTSPSLLVPLPLYCPLILEGLELPCSQRA
jgi:hypothetical protein